MLDASSKIVLYLQKTLAGIPFLQSFWLFVSNFSILISAFTFAVLYLCISRRTGRVIFISFIASLLVSSLLKIIIKEPRPFVFNSNIINLDTLSAIGFSFPSSHCIFCTSFVAGLTYEHKARIVIIPSSIMVFLLIISRVVLGAHYIHDCLFSLFVGILITFIVSFLNNSHKIARPRLSVLAYFLPLVVVLFVHFLLIRNNILAYNNIFYCLEGLLSFLMGDTLERKKISISCAARNLKRFCRMGFFILTTSLVVGIWYIFRPMTEYSTAVFVVFYALYSTFFFTKFALKLNLFEIPNAPSSR